MNERTKQKKLWNSIRKNWVLYLLLLPMISWYIIFQYIPIYGVQIAFQDYEMGQVFGQSEWVGLKHFIDFFESVWFGRLLKNTLTISILGLLIGFPANIILALMLNEVSNLRFRKTVQTVTYAPHFISLVVLCGTIKLFLSPSVGILGSAINAVRELIGLEAVNLLADGSAFKWIYVLSGVWQGAGWGSIIYFAALSGVDPQLVEAAKIDGANKLQCIRHINLPVLMPTIVINLILQCGSILNIGYEKVYLLQNDGILLDTEVISTYVWRSGLQRAQFSFSAAVGLFNSMVNAIILIVVNTIARKLDKETSLW